MDKQEKLYQLRMEKEIADLIDVCISAAGVSITTWFTWRVLEAALGIVEEAEKTIFLIDSGGLTAEDNHGEATLAKIKWLALEQKKLFQGLADLHIKNKVDAEENGEEV